MKNEHYGRIIFGYKKTVSYLSLLTADILLLLVLMRFYKRSFGNSQSVLSLVHGYAARERMIV